jgi:hypothetical protein
MKLTCDELVTGPDELPPVMVGISSEVVKGSVGMQEHAEEILVGVPLHCETTGGRPVVAVLMVAV